MTQKVAGLLALLGCLASCADYSSNIAHELQVVNEAPQAVTVTLDGEGIPAVFARNYTGDETLTLQATTVPQARGVWGGWVSVAGSTGNQKRTKSRTLSFQVDAWHRQIRATMRWDQASRPVWRDDARLVFQARRAGKEAVVAWSADRPEEVRVLDPQLVNQVVQQVSPSGDLVLFSGNLLLNGEQTLFLEGPPGGGTPKAAALIGEDAVYLQWWWYGFTVFGTDGSRLVEGDTEHSQAWSEGVIWVERATGSNRLVVWKKETGSALISEAASSRAETPFVDPTMTKVAWLRSDTQGTDTVEVLSLAGEKLMERSGNFDWESAWFNSAGTAFFIRQPGTIETWNLATGEVTVVSAPPLGVPLRLSSAAPAVRETSPTGARRIAWVRDSLWPVDDLVVVSDEGEVKVSTLPWVEEAQP